MSNPTGLKIVSFGTPGAFGPSIISRSLAVGTPLPSGTYDSDYLYWNKDIKRWVVGSDKVRLGKNAGQTGQGTSAIAIGNSAGSFNQGAYSIAIGGSTGTIGSQPPNSICILGTTGGFDFGSAGYTGYATYIKPIRMSSDSTGFTGPVLYNPTTGELAVITIAP